MTEIQAAKASINENKRFLSTENEDSPKKDSTNGTVKYVLYKERYLVTMVLALSLFINWEFWISLAAVNKKIGIYFNKTTTTVDWFGNVFLIVYAIQAVPFSIMPQLIGLKFTLLGGCICNLVGTLFRLASFFIGYKSVRTESQIQTGFILCLVGNIIASCGQGFLLNLPVLVSSRWFSDRTKIISTSITQTSAIFGNAMGFVIAPFLLKNHIDINSIQLRLLILAAIEVALSTIAFVFALFVKESPKTPPSNTEEQYLNQRKHIKTVKEEMKSFGSDFLSLHRKYKVFLLYFSFGIYYSILCTFYIYLSNMMMSIMSNVKEDLPAYTGFAATLVGAFFSMFLAYVLERINLKRMQQLFGSFVMLGASIMTSILVILIIKNKLTPGLCIGLIIIYGCMATPYLSIGYEVISNFAYPVPPNVAVSFAMIIANTIGFLMIFLTGYISPDRIYTIFLCYASALYLVVGVITYLFSAQNPLTLDTIKLN